MFHLCHGARSPVRRPGNIPITDSAGDPTPFGAACRAILEALP